MPGITDPGGGSVSDTSLAFSCCSSNSSPALSDISERDKPWDEHRAASDTIARHYSGTEFQSYSERIAFCSQLLDFRLVPEEQQGAYRLKLSMARFCHVRTCQICSWRRSLMYKARAYKALPPIVADYPSARYLFVTLTVKNCSVNELRDTLKWMNASFRRLTKLKAWPGIGYLKTVEVTRGRDGHSAHPHFHVLVMVPGSYFGRKYLSQKKWCELWQQSLRVDYQPVVDIQAIKVNESPVGLLSELVKYQCKPSQLIYTDQEWFLELTRQLHRTKAIAFGGIFKTYFADFERKESDEEFIGRDEENSEELDEGHLFFGWRRKERKYRLLDDH